MFLLNSKNQNNSSLENFFTNQDSRLCNASNNNIYLITFNKIEDQNEWEKDKLLKKGKTIVGELSNI